MKKIKPVKKITRDSDYDEASGVGRRGAAVKKKGGSKK